jgi:hypothetical protein
MTMRRPMLASIVAVLGCGDSTGATSFGTTAADTATTAGTGSAGSDDASTPSGTGTTVSTTSTTEPTTTPTSTSSNDTTAGGDTGLAGCQHAWDFSDCDAGWEVGKADPAAPTAPSWTCGDPTGVVAQGGAHTGVWGTNLSGNYGEDESSYLASPSFSLAGCAGATLYLTFAHLYELGSGDGATVQISTDGGTQWTTVEPTWHGYCGGTLNVPWTPPGGEPGFCGGDDETWLHTLVELDAYAGEPEVRIRFVLGSDGIIEQLGWYIDSVAVEAY